MKKIGLFVGVDRYEDQSIATLGCAARDARELGWVFRDRLGFTVEVLTDAELGSGSNVMSTLRKMGKELSAGDTFVFYFSGHGKSVGDRDQLFLLPHADAASVESGSTGEGTLSYTQLLRFTTSWVGVRRGFIFDACRSPLEIKKDGGPAQFEGEVVYRDFSLASSVGNTSSPFVILNSCHDQERAEELKGYEGGHGLFSAALLETFKHQAQLRKPVVIDEDLAHTVGESMRQLAIRYGGRETKQQPLFVGHGAKDLRLFGMEDQQNQQVQGLIADFERQLSQGKLERPVGDNCRDTLNRLSGLGYPQEELQGLSVRLEAALEDQMLQRCLQNDEQRIVAARLAGTMEAYAQYLATCEDCAVYREEAKQAIRELKEESSSNRQEEERLRQETAEQAKRQAEQQEAERQADKEEEAARIAQEKARLKKERDEAKVLAAAAEKRKQEEAHARAVEEDRLLRLKEEDSRRLEARAIQKEEDLWAKCSKHDEESSYQLYMEKSELHRYKTEAERRLAAKKKQWGQEAEQRAAEVRRKQEEQRATQKEEDLWAKCSKHDEESSYQLYIEKSELHRYKTEAERRLAAKKMQWEQEAEEAEKKRNEDEGRAWWWVSYFQIWGLFIGLFINGMLGAPERSPAYFVLYMNVPLAYLDKKRLKTAGYNTDQMGPAWLVPVYLFKRARVLKQNHKYLIVWCVFSLFFVWGAVANGL